MAAIQPIRLLRRNDFQQFAAVLLAADDAEFRAIRGDGGDFGADGFTAGRSIVYQAYAPDHMIARNVREKIDDSLTKADALRRSGTPIRTIRFVTPLDLTVEQDAYLTDAAQAIGLVAEAWGETRLIEVLARHPHVAEAFPETLHPSVIGALRELRAMLAAVMSRPQQEDPRFAENMFGHAPVFPDVYALQRHTSPTYPEHRAYAYWCAWVYSPTLESASLEPDDEDALVSAIQGAFVEDQNIEIDRRGDDHVWVQHRADDLRFHRRWARWTCGTVAMACNIRDWREGRADGYSLADIAIDLTRFLEMCGRLVTSEASVQIKLTMDPSTLRLMLDPSDDVARDRLNAKLRGVSSVTRPVLKESVERRYEGEATGAYLRSDARGLAADFLAKGTKYFHGARVDTKELAASIPDLIAANFRARSL